MKYFQFKVAEEEGQLHRLARGRKVAGPRKGAGKSTRCKSLSRRCVCGLLRVVSAPGRREDALLGPEARAGSARVGATVRGVWAGAPGEARNARGVHAWGSGGAAV